MVWNSIEEVFTFHKYFVYNLEVLKDKFLHNIWNKNSLIVPKEKVIICTFFSSKLYMN